jgi:hypothetical protein
LVCDDTVTSRLGLPWLLSWLEERVLAGERFRPGESLQIGWMFDQIVDRPDGSLGIAEPDFESMPVEWVDCVTLTLRHIWFQKESAASVAQIATYPSYRQTAVVCSRLRSAAAIVMHHDEPTDNLDSGWFIGCYDDDHDHDDVTQLISVSLYEVAVSWDQRFIAYAALPLGCTVVAGQGPPVITMGNAILEIVPGSLLSSLARPS